MKVRKRNAVGPAKQDKQQHENRHDHVSIAEPFHTLIEIGHQGGHVTKNEKSQEADGEES